MCSNCTWTIYLIKCFAYRLKIVEIIYLWILVTLTFKTPTIINFLINKIISIKAFFTCKYIIIKTSVLYWIENPLWSTALKWKQRENSDIYCSESLFGQTQEVIICKKPNLISTLKTDTRIFIVYLCVKLQDVSQVTYICKAYEMLTKEHLL